MATATTTTATRTREDAHAALNAEFDRQLALLAPDELKDYDAEDYEVELADALTAMMEAAGIHETVTSIDVCPSEELRDDDPRPSVGDVLGHALGMIAIGIDAPDDDDSQTRLHFASMLGWADFWDVTLAYDAA